MYIYHFERILRAWGSGIRAAVLELLGSCSRALPSIFREPADVYPLFVPQRRTRDPNINGGSVPAAITDVSNALSFTNFLRRPVRV